MNYRVIVFMLFLLSCCGFAQAQQKRYYIDATQVLCAGMDNQIRIYQSDVSPEALVVTAQGGEIRYHRGNVWIATPNREAESFRINVVKVGASGIKVDLFSHTYYSLDRTCKPPIEVDAYIVCRDSAGRTKQYRGGIISKAEILQAEGVVVEEKGTGIRYDVIEFELIPTTMMTEVMCLSDSSRFSDIQRRYIRDSVKGRKYYIRVRARKPDGAEWYAPLIEVILI